MHYRNDSSEISDVLSIEDLDMESFFWDDVSENLKCSSSFASVTLKANNSEQLFSKDGRFEILVCSFLSFTIKYHCKFS